jgi:hypothetical protein
VASLKEILEVANHVVSVLAVLFGGFWGYLLFVKRRQKYPRANLVHHITHRPFGAGKTLLQVSVTIANTGEVLLSLVAAEMRVQQLLPPLPDVVKCLEEGADPVPDGDREVQWPLLQERKTAWTAGEFQIEPGESDQICYDFFVDSDVSSVEVYSYFTNVRKRQREIGWHLTSIYDLLDDQ